MESSGLYLQLHSLRREAAVDAESVLREVAAMGFDGVETISDYGWAAERWRHLLNETGLMVVAAHADLESLERDLASKVEFQQALGNHRLVATALTRAPQSAERYHDGAQRLNAIGRNLREAGLTFVYHNHSYEFERLPPGDTNRCGMDILLAETDPALVRFEWDTHWLEASGHSSMTFIQAHANRTELIHAKDFRRRDRQDVPAGEGDVDFPSLIPLCATHGWPVILEYEGTDALVGIRRGADALRACDEPGRRRRRSPQVGTGCPSRP